MRQSTSTGVRCGTNMKRYRNELVLGVLFSFFFECSERVRILGRAASSLLSDGGEKSVWVMHVR